MYIKLEKSAPLACMSMNHLKGSDYIIITPPEAIMYSECFSLDIFANTFVLSVCLDITECFMVLLIF